MIHWPLRCLRSPCFCVLLVRKFVYYQYIDHTSEPKNYNRAQKLTSFSKNDMKRRQYKSYCKTPCAISTGSLAFAITLKPLFLCIFSSNTCLVSMYRSYGRAQKLQQSPKTTSFSKNDMIKDNTNHTVRLRSQ